jgi:lysophospholipase L1-like esterase
MYKRSKHLKNFFSDRDIVIIAILIIINIAIIGYGKVRDRNSTKELLSLHETSTNENQTKSESPKDEGKNEILINEIKNPQIIFPRNSNMEKFLKEGKFKGLILGDSIGQGLGDGVKLDLLSEEIGNGIFSNIKMLTKEDLMPINYSVGGSTVETMLSYIADNDKGKSKAYEFPYWILVTGRNEIEAMTVEEFKSLYKMVVALGERNGVDVICVTEPPQINMSTGKLVEDNYLKYKKVIEEVAKEEGATFIDIYNALLKKKDSGENISKLSSNGILPNSDGYKYIAELIVEGIVSKSTELKPSQEKSEVKLLTVYNSKEDVVKIKPKNLVTKTTAKEFNTGNIEVISLGAGEATTFAIPAGEVTGMVVTLIPNSSGGSVEFKSKNGELSKLLKPSGNQTKEISYFISLENIKEIKNIKEIIASPKGNVYVSGVTFIMKN